MQIGNVSAIATSALRLQSQRITQSAQNVANLDTNGYEARQIEAKAQPGGGVVGQSVPTYSPHSFQVNDDGSTSESSNTDIEEETVTQLSSLRSYQANIAVLHTADDMLGALLNRRA
jgi:flagellar basal-body rod protein FlgC